LLIVQAFFANSTNSFAASGGLRTARTALLVLFVTVRAVGVFPFLKGPQAFGFKYSAEH